ncbi:MAG: FAD:protein FMN transferase [Pseudomonadota bacterium]
MGTLFNITVSTKLSEKQLKEVFKDCELEAKRINDVFSVYKKDSQVSQVNKNAGLKPVKVKKEIIDIIKTANSVSKKTNGAFDITFLPVGKLWDFMMENPKLPQEASIKNKLRLINYNKIIIDEENKTVFLKDEGMSFGFGGIVKGYSLKQISEILKKNGINNAIVDGGGDLFILGKKPNDNWAIGVKDPRNKNALVYRLKVNKDLACVTSGDYERFFIYEDQRYHHIIDPKTGYPANKTRSVTLLAKDPSIADAYATAIFILGKDLGLKLANETPEIEVLLIDNENITHSSLNFFKWVTSF